MRTILCFLFDHHWNKGSVLFDSPKFGDRVTIYKCLRCGKTEGRYKWNRFIDKPKREHYSKT